MNLLDFNYPEVTGVDGVFLTFNTIPELLKESEERKFLYGHTPYNKLFSDLFFKGGKVVFKEGVDFEKRKRLWRYCVAFMKSWEPKHEHKEAICAMLMSEILEPNLSSE